MTASLSKGLIKADIIAAKQAIEYFEQKRIKDIKNVAAYHLQQAVEKILKYQIYQSGIRVDNGKMYRHDIRKLLDYAEEENIRLIVPDYVQKHANSITDWEAGSRYDIGFSVRIDALKKCYEVVNEWEKKI